MDKLRRCVALVLALLTSPSFLEAKTLRYSDHEQLGGMRTRFINDVFFAAIKRESMGRLRVEAHWGGTLSSSYDALKTVGKGDATDMAIIVPEYSESELPLHQIFKSYPVGPTGDRQLALFRRAYAEVSALPAELGRQNVVCILFATGQPVAFYSTRPLAMLDNLQGNWRTASFWHRDFLRSTGATPVTMQWGPTIPRALQSGKLDGIMVNVDSGYELGIGEVAPNILISRDLWLGHLYLLVMNTRTWKSLAARDRQAVRRAAADAYLSLGAVMYAGYQSQLAALRSSGGEVRELAPAELQRWVAATRFREAQANWVKRQELRGLLTAAPTMRQINAIMADMNR